MTWPAIIARIVEKLPGCRVIWGGEDDPYLLRVYLFRIWRKRLPGVFLHYFFRSDDDRMLHNHPWETAASIILRGGYREHRRVNAAGDVAWRELRPGDLNVLRAGDFHRVELIDGRGCWSLFIAGRETQTWGFSGSPGHFESIDDYERRKAAT